MATVQSLALFSNICQSVYEKQLIFTCFQKPQTSSCQNKTLCDDSSIILIFRKVIYKWVGVPDFREGQAEKLG